MLIILKLLSPLLFSFSSWFIILKKNTTGHKTQESIYCKDLIQTPGAPVLPFPAEGANPGAQSDDWLVRSSEKQNICDRWGERGAQGGQGGSL